MDENATNNKTAPEFDAYGQWMQPTRQGTHGRRRVTLTAIGQATLGTARHNSQAKLAERLAALTPVQQAGIIPAMQSLRVTFAPEPEPASVA